MSIQLRKIEEQLSQMNKIITNIETKVSDISIRQESEYIQKIRTAAEIADSALKSKNIDLKNQSLMDARNLFIEAKNIFLGLLENYGKMNYVIKDWKRYFQYLNCYGIASIGIIRCNLHLGEDDIAILQSNETSSNVAILLDNFNNKLNISNPDFIRIPRSDIPEIKVMREMLNEMHDRIDSYGESIKDLRAKGITCDQWDLIGVSHPSQRPLAYIRTR